MRISTSMMHGNAVSAMLRQQAELAKTQSEVATMKRVATPSDDPVAAVRILQLEQSRAASTQYGTNISSVKTRLELEEQALADSDSVLQRVSQLAIQANSSTLAASDRQSIATELGVLNKQLLDVANRKDANGEYLFAGLSSGVEPFSRNGSGNVAYAGDTNSRSLQVSSSQYVSDSDAGSTVFMNVAQGNGTFVSAAASANTGTGVITGSVKSISSWLPDDYTLSFTSATNWQVTDSASNIVSSGAFTAGTAIAFNGVQVTLTGAPASGDSFTIDASGKEDVFTTIDSLISAVTAVLSDDASKAKFQNQINNSIQQISQAETSFLNVRTGVGARMSLVNAVDSTREDSLAYLETDLSSLRDTNMYEATSRLSQQTVALQAAQQSYIKIAQLSLFSYL